MERIWAQYEDVFDCSPPEEREFFEDLIGVIESQGKNIRAIQRALDLMCKSVEIAKEELIGDVDGNTDTEIPY